MSVQNFNDLYSHFGHELIIAKYMNENFEPINAAIECFDCSEVLLDYDSEKVSA